MSRKTASERRRPQCGWITTFYICGLLWIMPATATIQPIREEYSALIEKSKSISSVGPDYFGEKIDHSTGRTEFRQVDLVLPGNNGLDIEVARRLVVDAFNPSRSVFTEYQFYDWELDIPYLYGVFPTSSGWVSTEGGRCSGPTNVPKMQPPQPHGKVWAGNHLHLPGGGDREILFRSPGIKGSVPAGAKYVAMEDWGFSCLSAIKNGEGEGFVGIGPDGRRYYFDWMASYYALPATFPNPAWPYSEYMTISVARQEVRIYPTKVEDRFGNSINYNWSGNRLVSMTSSDGREITIEYNEGGRISKISSGDRAWNYQYNSTLNTVTNPDGSSWRFDNAGWSDIRNVYDKSQDWTTCRGDQVEVGYCLRYVMDKLLHCSWMRKFNTETQTQRSLTITSPSGAVADYTFKPIRHARTDVPTVCMDAGEPYDPYLSYNRIAVFYDTFSIVRKSIYGPGVESVNWIFNYPAPSGAYKGASPTSDVSKQISILRSDGVTEVRTFGKVYSKNENQLLELSIGGRVDRFEYVSDEVVAEKPFPDYIGKSASPDGKDGELRPLFLRETTLDGVSFKYKVEAFDAFARPVGEVKSSSLGLSATQVTDYHDNLSKWVLGQIQRATTNSIETERTDYDGNAMPVATYAFGKLQYVLTYNPDGTISTVLDGNNNATTMSSWRRGIPQSIRYADGSTQSVVVDNNGWIRSLTDEAKSKTCYSYDFMGRLAGITYPSEATPEVCDASAWYATTFSFSPRNLGEHGLPAGHWLREEVTGNYRKSTFFDALWRPVLVHEYDAANTEASLRATGFTYDHEGRVTFASYAVNNRVMGATGIRTSYDALGRVKTVSQDSEHGSLTTTTEYLAGFKTKVTNPRGTQTITEYQVFDQPSTEAPTGITVTGGPLIAVTEIERDPFGKPRRITRRNIDGSERIDRRYVYDGYQQLCKTIEPETGATVMDYDGAGNLQWSAAGLGVPGTTSCDTVAGRDSGRKVTRSYDARNRLKTLAFPDGKGDQQWAYWPDGLPKQITTKNDGVATYNSYAYTRRRLLMGESLSQADGETWSLGYNYNQHGHLDSIRYPSGQTVTFAPNALGQATQAGSYASGVSYYPNGAIKQFTYGNGIVHTLAQNARQLPDTSQDAYGGTAFLSDSYDYDYKGNVAAITDGATGRNQRGNRTMTYDGLDRLTQTVSPMFGTAGYSYDVLDNLTHVIAAGRDHHYCYDGNWRLTNVKTTNCSGSTVVGLGYDAQGNLANKNGQGFIFDYGNRLREATGKETYRYDGSGRRTLATQPSGPIGSMYDQSGVLRFQKNSRLAKATDYIQLGGSLVAEAEWPVGQLTQTKDYVSWTGVSGATRYVVEEKSADGTAWTSVYEGSDLNWTSLARPSGTYSYRVLACDAAGVCTPVGSVTHVQRPAFNIVPLLYQILLS